MSNRSNFWSSPPAPGSTLEGRQIEARLLPSMPQVMVSGDLDGALAGYGLVGALGLLGPAQGERYAVRLARRRMLVVGADLAPSEPAWADGVARSSMTGALAVMEITGERALDLVSRATAIDPSVQSPCAALSFAGVTSVLYRCENGLRLHFDRGLSAYMVNWIASTDLITSSETTIAGS